MAVFRMSFPEPDDLLQCPYDKNHHIRACRFPYHLVKCRKNFPERARYLESCPFNARHRIPKAEMKHHITTCADKRVIEEDFVSGAQRKLCDVPLSTWQCPLLEEDWEKDEDESPGTFVYGYTNLNKNCIKARYDFPNERIVWSPTTLSTFLHYGDPGAGKLTEMAHCFTRVLDQQLDLCQWRVLPYYRKY